MISAKDLSDEQRTAIAAWAEDGAQLPDIQKRLNEELSLNATYMDTRFLVLDLGLELKSDAPPAPAEEEGAAEGDPANADEQSGQAAAPSPLDPNAPAGGAGGITVTTDELARPGALISGTVTFSDGQRAVWLVDQMGRPGLDPETPGYQPSDADLDAFELELRKILK